MSNKTPAQPDSWLGFALGFGQLSGLPHCADRMEMLQRQVDEDGLMARKTLQGPLMPHPLLAELRAQQTIFARLVKALRLPTGLQAGEVARDRASKFEMNQRALRCVQDGSA